MYSIEDYKIIIPTYIDIKMYCLAKELIKKLPDDNEYIILKEYFYRLINLAIAYQQKQEIMKIYSDKTKVIATLAIINLNLN